VLQFAGARVIRGPEGCWSEREGVSKFGQRFRFLNERERPERNELGMTFASPIADSTCTLNNPLVATPDFVHFHRINSPLYQIVLHQTNIKYQSTNPKTRTFLQSCVVSKGIIEVPGQTSHLSHNRISSNLSQCPPCSRSNSATSRSPLASDAWYGVSPSPFSGFTSAPRSSNSFTTLRCPLRADRSSGVI
jgi:hypothetical protein